MIKVREANKSEAVIITEFQLAMAMESEGMDLDRSILEKGVGAIFNDATKGTYFVTEHENKIVGSMLNTYEWSDWRNGNIIWFQSVYVMPEYRKLGVFKEMYAYVKALVNSDKKLVGMRLYVDKGNERAQKVYQALGMNGEHYDTYEWMK